ncbi:MAG: hypothetical protein ACI4SS_04330, partial [Clostridia bacterium]
MRKNSGRTGGFSGKTALELLAAAFIFLGPTAMNTVSRSWGLYAVFVVTAAAFVVRLIETGKIHISVNIFMGVLCTGYALLALMWAYKPYSHIRLIFTFLTVTLAMFLAADYFSVEKEKGIADRLSYMIIISAVICALWNIVYWCFASGFSLISPFSAGFGQSDLLGIYMFAGLWCTVKEIRRSETNPGGKNRRNALLVMAIPMLFALIMSRSLLTCFFGSAFAVAYLLKKGNKTLCIPFGAAAGASGAFILIRGINLRIAPFADGILCAVKYFGGIGGGGFASGQGRLQSAYYQITELGMGADMASSLGIF